jgi:hypothetical protein
MEMAYMQAVVAFITLGKKDIDTTLFILTPAKRANSRLWGIDSQKRQ